MEDILLIGGGGHCVACIDVIELEKKYNIVGVIDKNENVNSSILGYPIIGTDDDLPGMRQKVSRAFLSIGQIKTADIRARLFHHLKALDYVMPTIISPLAYVSKHAEIGVGCIVMHGAMINANVTIGDNVIINSKSLIEHDSVVEDHCHISTGAVINGGCHIQAKSFIGSNAVLKERVSVPENNFIKAGGLYKG